MRIERSHKLVMNVPETASPGSSMLTQQHVHCMLPPMVDKNKGIHLQLEAKGGVHGSREQSNKGFVSIYYGSYILYGNSLKAPCLKNMQWNFLYLLFRNYINISYSCGILRKRTSLAVAWYLFLDSSFWSKVCLSATHRRLCYLSNGPANSVTVRYFKKGYLDMLLKICGWGKNEIIQFTIFPSELDF